MNPLLRRRVLVVLWSVLVWCALWSDLSLANLVWGVCVGIVASLVIPLHDPSRRVTVRPLGVLAFVGYGLWALVKASAVVAWEVITPGDSTTPGIVAVPLRVQSVGVATLVANTVSLTPGTLTLEIRHDPLTLYVHVMHLRSTDEVRSEIGELEGYAMRALPEMERAGQAAPSSEEAS